MEAAVPLAEAQQSELLVEKRKLAGNETLAALQRVTAQHVLGSAGTWQQLCPQAAAVVTCT